MPTLTVIPRINGQESYRIGYRDGDTGRTKTFRDRSEAEAFANARGGWGRGKTGPHPRPASERMWERVDKSAGPDGCWLWTGPVNRKEGQGYGYLKRDAPDIGKVYVHRLSYELANGPIEDPDAMVCHHCDNPPCVNPKHLFLGDAKANVQDMMRKGRNYYQRLTHCCHGHEFSPENTRRDKKGRRVCRTCERAVGRRKSARRSAALRARRERERVAS